MRLDPGDPSKSTAPGASRASGARVPRAGEASRAPQAPRAKAPETPRAAETPRTPETPRASRRSRAPERTGLAALALSGSRFSTWSPRRRTHLLCLACASVLTLASIASMYPLRPEWIPYQVAAGVALALLSPWPLVGSALCLLITTSAHLAAHDSSFLLPALGPCLCAAVLLSRGFNRLLAYGLVAVSTAVWLAAMRTSPTGFGSDFPFMVTLEVTCLVVAELIRRPREQTEAAAERYREDLERQRLLVISELHDTVVRDLTQAVMAAEQARLAQPEQTPLAADLSALTSSVRTAVEQLRSSLRAMNDAGGEEGLDVLASSAPRPLTEVIAEAQAVMAGRGIVLETSGLEVLDGGGVPPGVRQQLVRVLSELVSNMAKHAVPGSARLVVDADGQSLEAMAANAACAPQSGAADGAVSSGLGLEGARRRVEALGGTFDATHGVDRFTVILSVPLGAP